MARGIAKLGRFLYERVQNVSQNLTKEKVKSELAWMAGNAAICGAAKILTAATLATVTPAAIATAAGIVLGGVVATSIRHIKEQVDVDVKKDGNTDSRLKLAIRHLNRVEIWDHMKTSQFRTRLLLNWGVSIGTFGLLEGTDIGQNVVEHAGKAFQKTTHWLSDRANAVFSMFHRETQLDLGTIRVNLKTIRSVPQLHPAAEVTTTAPAAAPVPVEVAAPTAMPAPPTPEANASNLIAKNGLRTPQQIKDYAYTLLNGKNGVPADPDVAIALYKEAAQMGNLQARADLAYLASQKDYKDFGLTEYLKSHPTPVTHSPTTGTAGAKSLAPTKPSRIRMEFPAPKPINPAAEIPVPAADPYDLSAYFRDETPEPPSAPRVVMECTTGLTPETIKTLDKTQPLIPDCDVRTNYVFPGDTLVIDGQEMTKAAGPRKLTLEWAGRLVEEFTARKAGLLRAMAEKFAAAAAPSPAPVALARVAETPENWLVHNIQ